MLHSIATFYIPWLLFSSTYLASLSYAEERCVRWIAGVTSSPPVRTCQVENFGKLWVEECQNRPIFSETGQLIDVPEAPEVLASRHSNFEWYYSQVKRRSWPTWFFERLPIVNECVRQYTRWSTIRKGSASGPIVGTVAMTVSPFFEVVRKADGATIRTSDTLAIYALLRDPAHFENYRPAKALPLAVEVMFESHNLKAYRVPFREYDQHPLFTFKFGVVMEPRNYAILGKDALAREVKYEIIYKIMKWFFEALTLDGDDLFRLYELPGFAQPISFSYGDDKSLRMYQNYNLRSIHTKWAEQIPEEFDPLIGTPAEMFEAFKKITPKGTLSALAESYCPPEPFWQFTRGPIHGIVRRSDTIENTIRSFVKAR